MKNRQKTVTRALWMVCSLASGLVGCGGGASQSGTAFSAVKVALGFVQPTSLAFAPDGRVFVCEKAGTIRVVKSGILLGSPAISISVSTDAERGLQCALFDPQFNAGRPYVYVYYTAGPGSMNAPPTPANRVSRFEAAGDTLAAASETVLLDGIPSVSGRHNGGCLRFGPDGKLYVSTGDGGVESSSQDLGSLSGKILRLNADGSVPSDNPFFGMAGKRAEVYCYGLRNPFKFTFRADNGAMLISDVGQSTWEELNLGARGANYGWPIYEGPSNAAGYVAPIHAYNHEGAGASIIGGPWVTSNGFPAGYRGVYYYAELIQNQVFRVTLRLDNSVESVDRFGPGEAIVGFDQQAVDLGQGPDGDLYTLTFTNGELWRIRYQ